LWALSICPYNPKYCGDERQKFVNVTKGEEIVIPRRIPAGQFCYYYMISDCGLADIVPRNRTNYYEFTIDPVVNMSYVDALLIPELN